MYIKTRDRINYLNSVIDKKNKYAKALANDAPYYEEHLTDENHLLHLTNPIETARLVSNFVDRGDSESPKSDKNYSFFSALEQISRT